VPRSGTFNHFSVLLKASTGCKHGFGCLMYFYYGKIIERRN
jgi:hypothetical protein